MSRRRLVVLSLGGTITMVPQAAGGIAPKLGAAELVASGPELAEDAEITADSPARLPSPSLTPEHILDVELSTSASLGRIKVAHEPLDVDLLSREVTGGTGVRVACGWRLKGLSTKLHGGTGAEAQPEGGKSRGRAQPS